MIGLDANVIIRYLAQDDPRQSAVATRLMEKSLSTENPAFVTLVTMCEIAWVWLAEKVETGRFVATERHLRGAAGRSKRAVRSQFRGKQGMP